MSIEKRYIVAPSDIHYGKYIVIDTKRETIYRFHNLASARAFAKQKKGDPKGSPIKQQVFVGQLRSSSNYNCL